MHVLSLGQIQGRLDDRLSVLGTRAGGPARHRTLRAAIGWSFELCVKPERLLWMRASVFAGGFDLAAEYVCAGDGLPAEE
jgi:non-specific serine/threonine protein kinase